MTEQLKANWFWLVAFALSVIVWLLTNTLPPQDFGYWELAVLFDVLVTLPLLFTLCYRRTLTSKKSNHPDNSAPVSRHMAGD